MIRSSDETERRQAEHSGDVTNRRQVRHTGGEACRRDGEADRRQARRAGEEVYEDQERRSGSESCRRKSRHSDAEAHREQKRRTGYEKLNPQPFRTIILVFLLVGLLFIGYREFYSSSAVSIAPGSGDAETGLTGRFFRDCPNCPKMVIIPLGNFDMGSSNGETNERPVHRVTFSSAFAIGNTEVTQGQWKAIMGDNPSNFTLCGDDCPVEQVSWDDAQAFIQKLNAKTGKQYRLPSEAEWEYACRAGVQQEYCGGDNLDIVGWYGASIAGWEGPSQRASGNSSMTANPVGRKQANAFGLYDMSGNVWEWVEDSYHENYNGAPTDGSAWQGDSAKRMLRGGSWFYGPPYARSARRLMDDHALRNDSVGFRLARVLP
jgi:formylglycine-generating enzyme required for sulfatase activity